MAADSPQPIATLLSSFFEDGQAAGSITPQYIRDLVLSFARMQTGSSQSGTSYTFAAADVCMIIEFTGASAATATVPANATVAYGIGDVLSVFQYGTGQVSFAGASGVTLRPATVATRAQYSAVSIRQRATNEWVAFGDYA